VFNASPINENSEVLVSIPHLTPDYFVLCESIINEKEKEKEKEKNMRKLMDLMEKRKKEKERIIEYQKRVQELQQGDNKAPDTKKDGKTSLDDILNRINSRQSNQLQQGDNKVPDIKKDGKTRLDDILKIISARKSNQLQQGDNKVTDI
jgi:hypothetical protein